MEIKIRPLIKVLNKIIKIPKGNYLDPTTLGSGVPDSSKFLAGDSSWVSSPVPTPLGYYGAFQDNSTQTLPAINTPTAMRLDTVDLSNQVTVENDLSGDPTRITVAHTGIYNIQWSGEFMNVTNAIHDVNVWIRINGTDVTGSNGIVAVPARKSASLGDEGQSIQGWNYLLSLNGGDYVEFLWMSEDLGVTLHYFAGGYPPPSTASLIVTVTQQSGIMAGTGMTALNGLSSDVQLLSVGTSGTDFNIDSTTDTHTFNLPTASATNRGALKKADWTTFNNKQNAITLTTTGSGAATFISDVLNIPTPSSGGGSGIFGISNSSGVYTYYATFTLAMAAATSGQTIEMFADVIETTNIAIALKNGVNINGNGHTYTLNQAGTANCIQDGGVAVNCTISNITFKRLGGTASSINTICMYVTGASKIKAYSTILIGGATNMRCLTINNANAEVYGIYAEGYNPTITVTNGTLNDSTGKSINGGGISVGASGKIIKCIGYGINVGGISNSGLAIDSFGYDAGVAGFGNSGTAINCTGWSNASSGFAQGSVGTAINCTGYSTASVGFFINGATNVTSCKGYSTANVGLSMINSVVYDCLGFSTANNGIYAVNSGGTITELRSCKAISTAAIALNMANTAAGCKIYNTEAYSKWNNVSGHGIVIAGSNAEIVQCTIEVSNASANAINATSALTTKYANNAFKGSTLAINANITQGITNTHDNQGNILV